MNRSEGQWEQPEIEVPASRGIALHSGNNFSVQPNLGTHWSADPEIASLFGGVGQKQPEDVRVFHGSVPMSSIEHDPVALKERGVYTPNHRHHKVEKEVPVMPGSPVTITGESRYRAKDNVWKERKRTFNPPRKGVA